MEDPGCHLRILKGSCGQALQTLSGEVTLAWSFGLYRELPKRSVGGRAVDEWVGTAWKPAPPFLSAWLI